MAEGVVFFEHPHKCILIKERGDTVEVGEVVMDYREKLW